MDSFTSIGSVGKLLQVLTGCVSSCEDHGYVIDIGVKGITAFLSSKDAKEYVSVYGEGLWSVLLRNLHAMLLIHVCTMSRKNEQ